MKGGVFYYLVGNKSDLEEQVKFDRGQALSKFYQAGFVETSAKEGYHIDRMVDYALSMAYEFRYGPDREKFKQKGYTPQSFVLSRRDTNQPKKESKCC